MNYKKPLFLSLIFFIIFFYGKNLNPFSKVMFEFHDQTQPARIQQFTLNLKRLNIPPRIAPDFYYKLGYPIFNFYAPTAYWITSGINLLGFDIVNSLKLSFLFAILLAFIFAFIFLKNFFDYYPSLFGGLIYITILYLPADIFIRGNLAEIWFITILPLSLYFLYQNSLKLKLPNLIIGVIILSLSFTSHNLLSMIFIPLSIIFTFLLKNKKINLFSIILALLLSSYFLLPLFLENHLTIAKEMAAQTKYQDNFLCFNQLWDSPWGFGGSIKGCNDGMPFKLGKLQIIFATLGFIFFLINFIKNKIKKDYILRVTCYVLLITIASLFMTTNLSQPIWNLLSPILAVFQFPWRFISFSMLGLAFFSSYFWNIIKIPYKTFIILVTCSLIILINTKYFQGKNISKSAYEKKYLSQKYIEEEAAFRIPEYFSNFPKSKEKSSTNLPTELIKKQTIIEKTANIITLLTLGFLGFILINKPLWKKITS